MLISTSPSASGFTATQPICGAICRVDVLGVIPQGRCGPSVYSRKFSSSLKSTLFPITSIPAKIPTHRAQPKPPLNLQLLRGHNNLIPRQIILTTRPTKPTPTRRPIPRTRQPRILTIADKRNTRRHVLFKGGPVRERHPQIRN